MLQVKASLMLDDHLLLQSRAALHDLDFGAPVIHE